MRITHVIVGLNVGGAELMLKRLIASHAGTGEYEHTVISLTGLGSIGGELRLMGVKVTPLGMRYVLDMFRTFFRLRNELLHAQPDIVQTWMYHGDLLGGLAARSVGIRRIVWGVRTTEIKAGGSRQTLAIRKICAFLSHNIPSKIVCAAEAARKVHEKVGYSASKMVVIPNGFVMEKLVAAPEQVAAIRRHAGITAAHRVVGSVGRFNTVKDQKNFVQAAGLLAQQRPEVRFMMVGRGLDQDNAQLNEWIAETGQAERFILLGERSDVPVCLAAMDVFCLHSRTEGFPNVVGEAMAMATPCVVTDVGDAAFLVGDTGIVVPKENASALAHGVDELLSLPFSDLVSRGLAGQKRIQNNFTMDQAKKRFEELYQSELGSE